MTAGVPAAVRGVSKRFGSVAAVADVSLELPAGSFTALLGPSGCGKSTLLALLAGLLAPDTGTVLLDGGDVTRQPAERRPIGLVFQKPLLFPHLTVAQNVAFGLRMRRTPRRIVRDRVGEMLERVQLAALAGRRVGELSGGQEQRAALARTLVLEPRLLLLDEPFSQLDAELRAQMRELVRALARERALTTAFVTHDHAEAVDVADRIVLMLGGRVEGSGEPSAFYTDPPSLAAARFFGATNELSGVVRAGRFGTDGVQLPVNLPDGEAILVVRPESLRLGRADDRNRPGLCRRGRLLSARFAGTHLSVEVDSDGERLLVHAPADATVTVGADVVVHAAEAACTVFPASG